MTNEELKKLVGDFPTYLRYVYSHIHLPDSTPLQNRIATILNEQEDRLILEAARGTGKSYIGAIFATWKLLRNVDEKILIVSASGPKAIEIATFIRNLFEQVPLLEHLRPGPEQRDSVLSFDVQGARTSIAPSVSALGITSQLTGKRATFVLSDDVEVPSNSATDLMREKIVQRVSEYEALLIPDMPSSVLFLGTPQSMESVYNKLPYRTVILPAQVPEDESVYEGKLDDWIMTQGKPGEPTDKVRFPMEVLLQRQAGMGLSNYKLQYMLDTTLSDAERFPLKCKDMIVYPTDSAEAPMTITYAIGKEYVLDLPILGFTGDRYHRPSRYSTDTRSYDVKIMSIDPSGSGSDETTYSILGVLNGNVYVLDWGGTRKGYSDEALIFLAKKAKEYEVSEIVPEKNFGSGMFTELFKRILVSIYPCTIVDDFMARGQKEIRIIDNIEPLLTNHKLVFNENRIREESEWVQKSPVENLQYSLMYQLTHITREKGCIPHDDRLDALAIGLQYIHHMVSITDTDIIEDIKKKEMEKFLYEKVYNKYKPYYNNYIAQY